MYFITANCLDLCRKDKKAHNVSLVSVYPYYSQWNNFVTITFVELLGIKHQEQEREETRALVTRYRKWYDDRKYRGQSFLFFSGLRNYFLLLFKNKTTLRLHQNKVRVI